MRRKKAADEFEKGDSLGRALDETAIGGGCSRNHTEWSICWGESASDLGCLVMVGGSRGQSIKSAPTGHYMITVTKLDSPGHYVFNLQEHHVRC